MVIVLPSLSLRRPKFRADAPLVGLRVRGFGVNAHIGYFQIYGLLSMLPDIMS